MDQLAASAGGGFVTEASPWDEPPPDPDHWASTQAEVRQLARPLELQRISNVVDLRDEIERVTTVAALPLFRGMLHAAVGEGESGKTWIGAHAVADVANDHGQVLVLDGEMSAPAWRRRLDALGISRDGLQLVSYTEMTDNAASVEHIVDACARLTADDWPPIKLIVWDSALSMLSRTARSENDNAEVSRVYDRLREIVRRTNTAGHIIDHTARGSASLISRGATAKFNALDIAYGIRLADGSVPGTDAPWSSIISVEKDRHGLLGRRADREAAFHPRTNGGVDLDICELGTATHRLSGATPNAKALADIAALDPPPKSANDACTRVGGTRSVVLAAYKAWKDTQ